MKALHSAQQRAPWLDASTAKGQFAIALAAGLVLLLLAPLVTPLPSLPAHAIHWVYVQLSGTQDEDNLKNAVKNRSFWESTPHVLGNSVGYAVRSDRGTPTETHAGTVAFHSISDVASNSPNYDGFPTEIVGRVATSTTISTDIVAPIGQELQLVGSDPTGVTPVVRSDRCESSTGPVEWAKEELDEASTSYPGADRQEAA